MNGSEVRVANGGDCRAVIGRDINPEHPAIACHPSNLNCQPELLGVTPLDKPTMNLEAVNLSVDHSMRYNPAEMARIIAEHPTEDNATKRYRVKGHLEVSSSPFFFSSSLASWVW